MRYSKQVPKSLRPSGWGARIQKGPNPFSVFRAGEVQSLEALESERERESQNREEEYSSQVHTDTGTVVQDSRVTRKEKRRIARKAWRDRFGLWTERDQ